MQTVGVGFFADPSTPIRNSWMPHGRLPDQAIGHQFPEVFYGQVLHAVGRFDGC
jgi:hypothetical protein